MARLLSVSLYLALFEGGELRGRDQLGNFRVGLGVDLMDFGSSLVGPEGWIVANSANFSFGLILNLPALIHHLRRDPGNSPAGCVTLRSVRGCGRGALLRLLGSGWLRLVRLLCRRLLGV